VPRASAAGRRSRNAAQVQLRVHLPDAHRENVSGCGLGTQLRWREHFYDRDAVERDLNALRIRIAPVVDLGPRTSVTAPSTTRSACAVSSSTEE
jgi:hypothetical protein